MKLKYGPVMWNKHAKHNFPEFTKPKTEIEVIDENTIKIDGQLYEFPANGVACPDIREQTNGVIEEAHRDEYGVLCLAVRRFFTVPGAEIAWYSEDYIDVKPTYRLRGSNVQQIKMQTQGDIDNEKKKTEATRRIAELLSYLASVDWYASRKVMTGKEIPSSIVEQSDLARVEISKLRKALNDLK